MHVGVVGDLNAELAHEVFLYETVLGHGERLWPGDGRGLLPRDLERAGRHVLELAGDHVDACGKVAERRLVGERPDRENADTSKAGAFGSSE